MAQFISTTKDNVKTLNIKQTVIIEDKVVDNKKVRNVYLGNYGRRQDAFYEGMQAHEMKGSRKSNTFYRLLKLGKLLAEVGTKGYNVKTNYFITEDYDDAVKVLRQKEVSEKVAAPEEPVVSEEVAQEEVATEEVAAPEEPEVSEEVVTTEETVEEEAPEEVAPEA